MKHALTALAFATLASSAHALTTYTFTYAGTMTETIFDGTQCGTPCLPTTEDYPWSGAFTLTAPDGDGVFQSDALTMTFDSRWQAWLNPMTATVADGSASLFGQAIHVGAERYSFGGDTTIGMLAGFDNPHHRTAQAQGTLHQIPAVPEPFPLAFLPLGLLAIAGFGLHRRQA